MTDELKQTADLDEHRRRVQRVADSIVRLVTIHGIPPEMVAEGGIRAAAILIVGDSDGTTAARVFRDFADEFERLDSPDLRVVN